MRRHSRKLVAKVSFDANKEHKLQEGGVKISADFKVDPKNELYASLPGEGTAKEFPFAEISIKHLNLQDGTNKAPLVKVADYKDNLQLTIDEQIHLEGFRIADTLASHWPTDIRIYATAKLDLADATSNNGTELYAMAQIRHIDTTYLEEYLYGAAIPFELSYKKGTLTMRTDTKAYLLNAQGITLDIYSMLLANPIGNLIDNALGSSEKLADAKAQFDNLYWVTKPDENGENGKFNSNFQGLVVKNLTVKSIIDMIGNAINKPTEPEKNTAGTSAEEAKANYYNTIVYAFTLFSGENAGKVNITSKDGILSTILKFKKYATGDTTSTAQGMTNDFADLIDSLLRGFNSNLSGNMVLAFDGIRADAGITDDFEHDGYSKKFRNLMQKVIEDKPGAIEAKFDFTKGLNWDIKVNIHETPEVSISWTSDIQFGEYKEISNIRDRIAVELGEKGDEESGKAPTGLYKVQKDAADKLEQANTVQAEKKAAYEGDAKAQPAKEACATKKALDAANSALTTAESAFIPNVNSDKIVKLNELLSAKVSAFTFTNARRPINDYLGAKYLDETEPSEENAADLAAKEAALLKAFDADNGGNFRVVVGKTTADVKNLVDTWYDEYKTSVGPKKAAVVAATKEDMASTEYKEYQQAKADVAKATFVNNYAKARVAAYEIYMKDESADRIKDLESLKGELPNKEKDYQDALDTISKEYEEIVNNAKAYRTALDAYLAAYKDANKNTSDATVKEKKAALDAAYAKLAQPIKTAITEEKVQTLADAFVAANGDTSNADYKTANKAINDALPTSAASSFLSSLKQYLKYRLAYEVNSDEAVKKSYDTNTGYLHNVDKSAMSEESLTAAYNAYKEAYTVTVVINAGRATLTESNNLEAAQARVDAYYVWFTLDLAA